MTSNENDLIARIRHLTETEDREMNEIAARELQTFGETLRERVRHKLHTIETVMETETGRIHGQLRSLRELLWRDFRADLVIVVSILLIIFGASWGLMRWQLNRVQNLLETQETLRLEIAEAQTALDQLQAQTWGVWLHEESDGMRYVVLPRGTFRGRGVAVDRARAACRAGCRASEGLCMTELETRLMDALKALSDAVGRGSAAARRGTGHVERAGRAISRSW